MNRASVALAILLFIGACRPAGRPSVDGRAPVEVLQSRFRELTSRNGWIEETVFDYPAAPGILAWRTRKEGRALWLLAGIHGEEPAGPNAVAKALDSVAALAEAGVPIVLLPLCNPKAYAAGWRYPNTPERDWRKGGYSVGDAEYLLPDPKAPEKPRAAAPPGPETAALTNWALDTSARYPPALVIDLHEDELSMEGGYLYSQGPAGKDDPVAREMIRLLKGSTIPLRTSGKTRFGEPIVDGIVERDENGGPLRDGSIDELLASDTALRGARTFPGPGAPTVIVVETPAFAGSRLSERVEAQRRVVERLSDLWRLANPGKR